MQEACLRLDDTHVKGVGVKHLHLNVIRRIEVYTPTLDMQRRIVAKVSELLALCDQLKARIAAGRVKQAQLAEALVKQAVAAAG
ncbi:type I restriction enzyme, S subunit [Sphaerotilus natans]|nr:type I restriction enzyme, S subunit [Sphaerotilus natans]